MKPIRPANAATRKMDELDDRLLRDYGVHRNGRRLGKVNSFETYSVDGFTLLNSPVGANIITSLVEEGDGGRLHMPVLDWDFTPEQTTGVMLDAVCEEFGVGRNRLTFVPSTSHQHLYIDCIVGHDKYMEQLRELSLNADKYVTYRVYDNDGTMRYELDTPLVEAGFYHASDRRGCTCLRLPWIKKNGGLPEPVATTPVPAEQKHGFDWWYTNTKEPF